MGRRRVSNEEKEVCWKYWCEFQSIGYVQEKHKNQFQFVISVKALNRMRIKEKWDDRLERLKKDAEIIADARSSKRLARNLEIVRFTKEKIVAGVQSGEIHGYVSDIPALIKTEELLVGNPDSRPDQPIQIAIIRETVPARSETSQPAGTDIRHAETVQSDSSRPEMGQGGNGSGEID